MSDKKLNIEKELLSYLPEKDELIGNLVSCM